MAFVALFDILGFKDFVAKNDLATLKKTLGRDLDVQIDAMTRHLDEERLERVRGKSFSSLPAFWRALSRGAPSYCEHVRFSDTILLYVAEETRASFWRLIIASQRLFASSLFTGMPMRGAITRGDLYVSSDKRLYVGNALVRAYELEQAQDWAGVLLDAKRFRPRPLTQSTLQEMREIGLLVRYPAPRKEGPVRREWCIGWPFGVGHDPALVHSAMAVNGVKDWSAQRKIRATVDFYRYYQQVNAKNELHVESAKEDLKIRIRRRKSAASG